jgi:hypothetical protein
MLLAPARYDFYTLLARLVKTEERSVPLQAVDGESFSHLARRVTSGLAGLMLVLRGAARGENGRQVA